MNKAIILVFLSVTIGIIGQYCIKAAMLKLGPLAFSTPNDIIIGGWQIMKQPLIWIALPLYGAGFVIWALALSQLELSYAYPLLSISYVLVAFIALIFFNEPISLTRWAGIITIIIGIVLIGHS